MDDKIKQHAEKVFKNYCKKNNKIPTLNDFVKYGLKESTLRTHYGSVKGFIKDMLEKFPEFKKITSLGEDVKNIFTKERHQDLKNCIGTHKKFFITTVVADAPINQPFYDSIKTYCKKNDACLLIMVANKKYEDLRPDLLKEQIVFTEDDYSDFNIVNHEIALNSNIHLSTIPIPAKQIRTLTGLNRICQRKGPTIVAAPKQFLKYVPVSKQKPPHCIMSTGALTDPVYESKSFIQKRTDYIAYIDHTLGGIIVELENDKIFHFRQVTADRDGSFCDLNMKYYGKKVEKINPEAFVMGDLHSIRKDPKVFDTWLELMKDLKPNQVILHDVFDGVSISHHTEDKDLTRALHYEEGMMNLEKEIDILVNDLNRISEVVPKMVIVKSNHDEHLFRYLDEGRYMKDYTNRIFAHKLINAIFQKKDPLQEACILRGFNFKNAIWLKRDEDYYIANVQLGSHGDLGANGGRGGISSFEDAYGDCVVAHSHTPQIFRGVWVVGTSSKMEMGYNVGLSSWMNTSALVFKNGERQLINYIFGKWRVK